MMPPQAATDGALRVETPAGQPHLLVVTMDRPPVNALSLDQSRRIRDLFRGLHDRRDIRCVILTGAGDRAFCGGADVREISERTTQIAMDRSVVFRETFDAIRRAPVPVIAAVQAHAPGAGLVIASCCDIVIAADRAQFALPEIVVGVMGGGRHALRVVPDKVVRYMALTGRRIDAAEMQRLGAVMQVVPAAQVMEAAMTMAEEIATRSPSAVRLMKEAINLTEDMPVTEGYRVEQVFTTLASALPDAKEASLAWLEKRKPVWSE